MWKRSLVFAIILYHTLNYMSISKKKMDEAIKDILRFKPSPAGKAFVTVVFRYVFLSATYQNEPDEITGLI